MSRQQHAYGKGTADGEIVFGKVMDDTETTSVLINNRADKNGQHYIAMYKTGDDHLKGGTILRSMGGLYAKAGDTINSGHDNSDGDGNAKAPDISENVPAIFLEATTNDIVLNAPQGKVRICAQQIELVATGPDDASGNVIIDGNEAVIINAGQDLKLRGNGSVAIASGQRMDIIAKSILNTYGGTAMTNIDNAAAGAVEAIIAIVRGGATSTMSMVDIISKAF
tara:strand:+ start:1239 stop:1910 length:672 start_codon:yes stop_codon:yes gene_type:complete